MLTTNEKALLQERGFSTGELLGEGSTSEVYAIGPYKGHNDLCIKFIRDAQKDLVEKEFKNCKELYETQPDRFAKVIDLVLFDIPDKYDITNTTHCAVIVMERLAPVKRIRNCVDILVKMLYEIAFCLGVMHISKTYHRDVKLKNIMYSARTGTYILIDYNFSVNAGDTFTVNSCVGTLNNVAPESLNGTYSQRSDIYSLGMVAREWFNGYEIKEDPKLGLTQQQIDYLIQQKKALKPLNEDICDNPDLVRIINKMTAYNRKDRHKDYRELIVDLNKLIDKYNINVCHPVTPKEIFLFGINSNNKEGINDTTRAISKVIASISQENAINHTFVYHKPLHTRPVGKKLFKDPIRNVEILNCEDESDFLSSMDSHISELLKSFCDGSTLPLIHVCTINPSQGFISRFLNSLMRLLGRTSIQIAHHIVHSSATEHVSNKNISEISILNSTIDLERYFAFLKENEAND